MSKLSEFQGTLTSVSPGMVLTLDNELCQWLNEEIDRIQRVAKQALLDQRTAEAENKEFKRVERLQKLIDATPYSRGEGAE